MDGSIPGNSEIDNDAQSLRRSPRERRPPGEWWHGAYIPTITSNDLPLQTSVTSVGGSPHGGAIPTLSRQGQSFIDLPPSADHTTAPRTSPVATMAANPKQDTTGHCSPITPTPPKLRHTADDGNTHADHGQGRESNPAASCSATPISLPQQPSTQPETRPCTPLSQSVSSLKRGNSPPTSPNMSLPLSPPHSGSTTPPASRRPFHISDDVNPQEHPAAPNAPRKNRRSSPSSRFQDLQPIPIDLTLSTNSSDADTAPSVYPTTYSHSYPPISPQIQPAPLFMLARRSGLHFSDTVSSQGVNVATALSCNASILGELRIPPHGTTGLVCTFGTNEMYFIQNGRLEVEIGDTTVRVCEGDYLGLPHVTFYEIRNPMTYEASIIFFSPPR